MKNLLKPKLIIFGGMSGAGKSTTAKKVTQLFMNNGIKTEYYHEEMADHPIRWANGGEFSVGDLMTHSGMKANIEDYFSRWNALIDDILTTDHVHVMEGCLFQTIMRYFNNSCLNYEEITKFYDDFYSILNRLDTTLVFLYPKSVKATLEQAFEMRGDRWKNIILDKDGELYFESHPYTGVESIFSMYEDFREMSLQMFNRYKNEKLMIEVTPSRDEWSKSMIELCELFGLQHMPDETSVSVVEFPTGLLVNLKTNQNSVELHKDDEGYYIKTSWWKRMVLLPRGNDTLEAESFPIVLTFNNKAQKTIVRISGGYGWSYDNQDFVLQSLNGD